MCGKWTVPANYTSSIAKVCCLYCISTSGYWRHPRPDSLSVICPFLNHRHFSPFSAPVLLSRERQQAFFPGSPSKEVLCRVNTTNIPPHTDIWIWGSTFITSSEKTKLLKKASTWPIKLSTVPSCFRLQYWEVLIPDACTCFVFMRSISQGWRET